MNQPWHIPSADTDHILHHVSNRMATSQLFRRLSANSNSSSPSRRGNARVAKIHSNGTAPHGVQRRKTTAAHTSQTKPRTSQPADPSQALPQTAAALAHRARNNGLSSTTRPLTWHPGSYPLNNCLEEIPHNDTPDFQSLGLHQGPAYTDPPNYLLQSSIASTPASNTRLQNVVPDVHPQLAPTDLTTYPFSYYNPHFAYMQQDTGTPGSYDSSSANLPTVDFSQIPSDYTTYSTQHTPDAFQLQFQASAPQYVQSLPTAKVTKQKSKELVGMGLYDGPSRRELSSLNVSPDHIGQLLAQPQGKGLKLEETWQPPNDEAQDAEEEGYSTDEAEEDLPAAPAPQESQAVLLPATYGDLSNQSFFFDSDDPFADYMSFDPGVQVCQPKMSDMANQNFMWL
ncbi:MAG: hypothetical protein Q9171_000327 [Xanthocarpia ochracea]